MPSSPWKPLLFIAAAIACSSPWSSAPIALTVGCILALLGLAAFPKQSKAVSRQLIQWCVATLGLLIPLPTLLRIATDGLLFATLSVIATFALGILLMRLLRTGREQTILLSAGTAVCGGSAIAATGAAIGASSSGMALATASIFLLNAAGLYALPPIGHWLGLTDAQFGAWAGIALHDVSSVMGAANSYATDAAGSKVVADTATVVKLSRVLWLVPISLIAGWWVARHPEPATEPSTQARSNAKPTRPPVPWLIILFLLASLLATFIPAIAQASTQIRAVAAMGFQLALFLIGSGLSIAAIKSVGWRALLQALIMWLALAGVSLAAVKAGW
jgi:uncharacterized integral membrane protein (TIGR00698 family)